jgi:hypothetical protein
MVIAIICILIAWALDRACSTNSDERNSDGEW